MSKIIDGRLLAEKIKDKIVKEISGLQGERPNLAIILVGEREDSRLYAALKEKEAKKVGIDTHLYKFPEDTTDAEVLETINFLNNDNLIDAILVQLPLPDHLDTDGIIMAINKNKDVDGFSPDNLEDLFSGKEKAIMPPVFGAVLEMFDSIGCELNGKSVCLIANSSVFGRTLAKILSVKGAAVEVMSVRDPDLGEKTSQADIIITAVGQARFLRKEMIKKDAVIIDVGICQDGGRTCGDADFEDLKEKAGYITPVPGGVGPLTIAMAFKNTLLLYKRRR